MEMKGGGGLEWGERQRQREGLGWRDGSSRTCSLLPFRKKVLYCVYGFESRMLCHCLIFYSTGDSHLQL